MPKRIALFILGVFLAVGAFLLYQYVSGPDPSTGKKAKLVVGTAPTTLPMVFESRDANMQLEYVITAAESPLPVLDSQKNPIPGQFILKQPLATFYGKNGRIMQVSADLCQASVEQGAKGTPGLGALSGGTGTAGTQSAKLNERMTLRSGLLRGHVRMTITPERDASPNDFSSVGLRAYFDEELVLDGIQEILTTTGPIHIRSDRLDFDGQGMQLAYNREAKRIDYLRFDTGKQVIVRGVGSKALAFASPLDNTATKPALPSAASSRPAQTQLAATKPAATNKSALAAATYRMSFGQDVAATVMLKQRDGKLAESSFSANRLYVTFLAAGSNKDSTTTRSATATATAPAEDKPPVTLQVVESPEPIAPAKVDDLTVSWVGPMEMRPAAEPLTDSKDIRLEAIGTADKPVRVQSPQVTVAAGHIFYDGGTQKVLIKSEDYKKIVLSSPKGNVECLEAAIDQVTNKIALTGPGTLASKSESGDTVNSLTWKHIDVDLASVLDPEDPEKKKTTLIPAHAVIQGIALLSEKVNKTARTTFSSDLLDVTFANVIDGKKQSQPPQHILATGNVVTERKSADKTTGKIEDGDSGGIQTQRLEFLTTWPDHSKAPVFSQMLADGNVTAWQLTTKDDFGGSPASAPAPARGEAVKPTRRSLTAPRLVADLIPKPPATRPATLPAGAVAVATATAPISDLASMGDFDVTHFTASGGVRVEIASPTRPVIATALNIEGVPTGDKQTTTLTSAGGNPADMVKILVGKNSIEGRVVDLVQVPDPKDIKKKVGMINVRSGGTFVYVPNNPNSKNPPMQVTWRDTMQFDQTTLRAVFEGHPIAQMREGASGTALNNDSRLEAEKRLTIQLKPAADKAAAAAPGTGPASRSDPFDLALELDWMLAEGSAEARGAKYDADGKLVTSMSVSVKDPVDANNKPTGQLAQLRYSETLRTLDIPGPGAMVVMDLRPEKAPATQPGTATQPDKQSETPRGNSNFQWAKSFHYDAQSGKVTFDGDVYYIFQPLKPLKLEAAFGPSKSATRPATAPGKPESVYMHTEQLVATFDQTPTATAPAAAASRAPGAPTVSPSKAAKNPVGIEMGDLLSVAAKGSPWITLGSFRLEGLELQYNATTKIVTITGNDDVPVRATSPGKVVTADSVTVDLTQEKNGAFHAVHPRGDLLDFGL